MADRRDTRFLALAVVLSLVLHAGFFLFLPGMRTERPRPTRDVVVVDLVSPLPSAPSSEKQASPAAPRAEPDEAEQALPLVGREPPQPAEPPPSAAAATGAAAHLTTAPAAQAGTPIATGAYARGVTHAATGARAPIPSAMGAGAASPAKSASPSLGALLPTRRDLAAFRNPSGLPDPAAGEAREATLGLGDEDERYRGYRDQVWSSIYGAWRVGKALVVAGGSRSVLVRLSIDSMGLVQEARVVEGSGNPTLDAEALDAVRRARIPPFPSHWTIERLHLMARFDYVFR